MRSWLKGLREKSKFSQAELASRLNIAQQYYSLIENGERQKDLDLSMATKLAKIFDVSIDWIVAEEEKLK